MDTSDLGLLLVLEPSENLRRIINERIGDLEYLIVRQEDGSAQIFNQRTQVYFPINAEVAYWLDYLAILICLGSIDHLDTIIELEQILAKIVPIGLIEEIKACALNSLCDYKLIH